jgi:hypothetical protein
MGVSSLFSHFSVKTPQMSSSIFDKKFAFTIPREIGTNRDNGPGSDLAIV